MQCLNRYSKPIFEPLFGPLTWSQITVGHIYICHIYIGKASASLFDTVV